MTLELGGFLFVCALFLFIVLLVMRDVREYTEWVDEQCAWIQQQRQLEQQIRVDMAAAYIRRGQRGPQLSEPEQETTP